MASNKEVLGLQNGPVQMRLGELAASIEAANVAVRAHGLGEVVIGALAGEQPTQG